MKPMPVYLYDNYTNITNYANILIRAYMSCTLSVVCVFLRWRSGVDVARQQACIRVVCK